MTLALVAVAVLAAAPVPVSLKARQLVVDARARQATYEGEARAIRGTTTLTCQRLIVSYGADQEVTTIVALGDVHAVDGDREAWGERGDYDNRTGVLTVTGAPRGRQGSRHVEGTTVTFASGTDELTVLEARTRAEGEPAARGQPVTIAADVLSMPGGTSTALWRGHVRAVRADTVLEAPQLLASWNDAGEVVLVVATGGIRVTERARVATGREARYDVVKGELVVTGAPEAWEGTSHMRGSRVILFPDTERIEVENAETVVDVEDAKRRRKR